MEKIKLKTDQEVIYYDGTSIIDKTVVVEINKEKQTAKLANGIVICRESTKKGYFKRSGIRSEAKAWLSQGDNEGTRLYNAYIAKAQIRKQLPILMKLVDGKEITFDKDQAYLVELLNTLKEFMQ